MIRSKPLLVALSLSAAAAVLIGAAKPVSPPAAPFVPALAYKYGSQDIRLANADGSQAVLLVRRPSGSQPLWLAIAPISKRQVAYIDGTDGFVRAVRTVSWTQAANGGSLTVAVDPEPLITRGPSDGIELRGLDYSPDGTQLAVLATDSVSRTELRFFDIATRAQIGETILLPQLAQGLSWRSSDNSILLRGTQGMSSFKNGVQTSLFGGNTGTEFDAFNGGAPEVMLPYSGPGPGGTAYRWDGVTVTGDEPLLTQLVVGLGWSVSCDNSRLIYTDFAARRASFNMILATGEKVPFSKDSSVQRMEYPNSCA